MSRRAAEPTRLRTRDALGEAVTSMLARPLRSLLTATGTLLVVASFVAVLGIASSAAAQVTSAFNQRLPTEVRMRAVQTGRSAAADPFPADVERRLDRLNGVLAAGLYWRVPVGTPLAVSAHPPYTSAGSTGPDSTGPGTAGPGTAGPGTVGTVGVSPMVFAASPGFLRAAGAQVGQGRLFGTGDQARAAPVCLVGARAARALGISGLDHQPAIIVNDLPCTVIGLISRVRHQPWIMRSVLMPSAAATAIWGSPGDAAGAQPGVLIETRPGAAALIARQAPLAVSAENPGQILVTVPPSPRHLRSQVNTTLNGLYLALAVVCLLIGAAGIGNMTLIAVRERTAEVGLRRALGARRRHIAAQFLAESALLGLLGGLAGINLGVGTVLLVAIARGWTPVIAPLTVLPAPLIGAAAGLLAGLYPSWRASHIEPARALSEYPAA